MIAMKAMLDTHRYPTTNYKWEDLGRSAQTLGKWKEMYKKSEKQERVKSQAAGAQDQFGGAMLGTGAGVAADPGWRGTTVTIDEL